ncbi:MAG: hypothetical protein IJT62_09170 [Oscillospiraceae bacterium]|nr:hypothetical protein [Oscillospiraceae bacterium]
MNILCRVRISVWEDGPPDVCWTYIEKHDTRSVTLRNKVEIRGRKKDRIDRRELGRAIREAPGVASCYWIQDDMQPIRDGANCTIAKMWILDALKQDMQTAAVRLSDLDTEILDEIFGKMDTGEGKS